MNSVDYYDIIEIPSEIGCGGKCAIISLNDLFIELRTMDELCKSDEKVLLDIPRCRLLTIIFLGMKLKKKKKHLAKSIDTYVKIRIFIFKHVLEKEDQLTKVEEM